MAFEYRAKRADERWQTSWEWAIFWTSAIPAFLWGVAFANIAHGVAIDRSGEFTGQVWDLFGPYALLGGLVTLSLFTFHGAVFAALKTLGDIRARARRFATGAGWRSPRCSPWRSWCGHRVPVGTRRAWSP